MPRLALIQFIDGSDGPVDPSYGVPGFGGHPGNALPGGGGRPDNSLPGMPVYPSHPLPGGGHISLLPVFPFDPTLKPDNSLPGDQPEAGNDLPVRPGRKFVVKWLCGVGMILVPDNSLPETPEPK